MIYHEAQADPEDLPWDEYDAIWRTERFDVPPAAVWAVISEPLLLVNDDGFWS